MDGNEAFLLALMFMFVTGIEMIIFGISGYIGAGIALVSLSVLILLLSQPRE